MHYKEGQVRENLDFNSFSESLLCDDNPVALIDIFVDKVIGACPEEFVWKGQSNQGCRSYSPAVMQKLLLYGYFNGIAGSRKLSRECLRNIELIWLLGGLAPKYWAICEYRRENGPAFRLLTVSFRLFLKGELYIGGKKVAYDGTKFKANASREGVLGLERIAKRLEKLESKQAKYLEAFNALDLLDTQEQDATGRLLLDKVAALESELQEYKSRELAMQERGQNYSSPNSEDAPLLKSRDGKVPGYNGQIGVDAEHKLIVLAELENDTSDIDCLQKNHDGLKQQLGIVPEEEIADKGYGNTEQIKHIEESSHTQCHVPLPENKSGKKDKENGIVFEYDKEKDLYTCPQGKELKVVSRNYKQRGKVYNVYGCKECDGCPIREKCTKAKTGRRIKRNVNAEWIEKHKKKMQGRRAKEKMKQRKAMVEHPFGTIKALMGKFCFLLCGRDKAQIEFDIYATVYNLKRLVNITPVPELIEKIKNYDWKAHKSGFSNFFSHQSAFFALIRFMVRTGNGLPMPQTQMLKYLTMHFHTVSLRRGS